jgi:hypothetical protein
MEGLDHLPCFLGRLFGGKGASHLRGHNRENGINNHPIILQLLRVSCGQGVPPASFTTRWTTTSWRRPRRGIERERRRCCLTRGGLQLASNPAAGGVAMDQTNTGFDTKC